MIIKTLKEIRRQMVKHSEKFNKGLESIKKNQAEMKNTIIQIKNTLKGIKCSLDDTEKWISKLEDSVVEITQAESKKEKKI